jgi:hypothetical protein
MEFMVVAMYVYFPPVRASPIRQLEQGVSLVWDAERRKWFLDLRKVSGSTKGVGSTTLSSSLVRE